MKYLKEFREFLDQGIVKKQRINLERSKSLFKEARNKKQFFDKVVKRFSLEETNSNYVVEASYDILIELLRAKLFAEGFNSNSHEAEVSYMRDLGFSEKDVIFMNSLRYFRNGIKYYGKVFSMEYSKKVFNFLNKIYPKLIKLL